MWTSFNTWDGGLAAHRLENDNLAADSAVPNNVVKYVSPEIYGTTVEGM